MKTVVQLDRMISSTETEENIFDQIIIKTKLLTVHYKFWKGNRPHAQLGKNQQNNIEKTFGLES
jgi:hypothetical protein